MAHQAQVDYCLFVKNKFPEFFKNTRVVDFGSLDINGSNRQFFDDCEYTGLDIGEGKNVDIVTKAHEYNAPDSSYDVVVSQNMAWAWAPWALSHALSMRAVSVQRDSIASATSFALGSLLGYQVGYVVG